MNEGIVHHTKESQVANVRRSTFLMILPVLGSLLADDLDVPSSVKPSSSRCLCFIARIISVFIMEMIMKGKIPSKKRVIMPAIRA